MDDLIIEDELQKTNNDVLHKADLMKLNNGWNDKNERIIISIGENAASYKWMHEKCANHHKFIYKFLSILLIVLSTTLSAETIFYNQTCDFVIETIKRVFIYIVNALTVLQTFLKSQEESDKHLVAAGAYNTLYHDIQQQMCMFRRDRVNATKYISECLKQYDSLIVTSPDISSRILNRFKNTFKDYDIALPEIADKLQKIEIITEDHMNISNKVDDASLSGSDNKIDVLNFNLQKRINRNGAPLVLRNKQSSVQNCNNLAQIHNAFQIHGDISDRDLENIDSIQLRELRKRFLQQKSEYEFQRFIRHSSENE
jgi:hypothetical protein